MVRRVAPTWRSTALRLMDATYDLDVIVSIEVEAVRGRTLAAVRCNVPPGEVRSSWGPAVGKVWDFLRGQPGLWTGGHNIFIYRHAKGASASLLCDFGVEVTRPFDATGEVFATETPSGEALVAVYRGPYDGLQEAYDAIDTWMAAHGRSSAGPSWEIYGDPTPE